jgi:hypothetical protein
MPSYNLRLTLEGDEDGGAFNVSIPVELPDDGEKIIDQVDDVFSASIRQAALMVVSQYLEELSKKKPNWSKRELEEQLKAMISRTEWTVNSDE